MPAIELLFETAGALSVTLTDPQDTPVLEPGVGETPLWPEVVVTALFESHTPVEQLRASLAAAHGDSLAALMIVDTLPDQDWERAWMADFKAMQFGRGLWIVPTSQDIPAQAEIVLRLDPGLAFGTGTHPTTRLCLEWIDGQNCTGATVVDFGCGSGVLGIATALKGAERVWCVDNDPQALTATRDNAQANGVLGKLVIAGADVCLEVEADLVVANILAGTLIELAPVLAGALRPGGRIVLSGILEQQAGEVATAYAPWVPGMQAQVLDGWVALCGRKPDQ